MDINDLGNVIMSSVKNYIATKYFSQAKTDDTYYDAYDYEGNPVTINMFIFSASVMYKSLKSVVNYQFLKHVGEILTYYKFEACEDGSLNVIHGRSVRCKDESFMLMVRGANVRYVTNGIVPEKVVAWPHPYYGLSYEDTLKLLERNGKIEVAPVEPEFAECVTAEDIHAEMENLAANVSNKLNVEPSR